MENEVSTDIEKQAEIARIETLKLAEQSTTLTIRKDADLEAATEVLAQAKSAAKNIKLKKESVTKPLQDALNAARALFKPAEEALATTEKNIKAAMLKYDAMVTARAKKKADEIEAAVDAGEMEVADAMTGIGNIKQAPTKVEAVSGTVSFKEGPRRIRIVDPTALPTKYLLKERVVEALRLAVSEDVIKNDLPCPPGAEVYREKQVAGRVND